MNIELKVVLDTEKKRDLDMIEDVMFQLQDIKEILEARQENLNKKTTTRRRTKKTTQE
jgi:hypothetical protein